MWWIVALTSAGLIGLGVMTLVRDLRGGKAEKAGSPARATKEAGKQQSRKRSGRRVAEPAPTWTTFAPPSDHGVNPAPPDGAFSPSDETAFTVPGSPPRVAALEIEWPRLRSDLDQALRGVEQQLAPLGVAIGAPGAPTWSLGNEGFGDFRRVLIDGDSIAWLRIEMTPDRGVSTKLRAHDTAISMINGQGRAAPPCSTEQLGRALQESLATTMRYADWRLQTVPRTAARKAESVDVAAPLPATLVPQSTAALADAAIALVNSAFQEAGAKLMPLRVNQWPGDAGREARVLALDANGALAGTLLIDPQPNRIEIAVTSGSSATASMARRQSLPTAGLSVHQLAEIVATSVWPSIAAALPKGR